ncbi:MAG: rhodanese-like domain-containing protein [Desulfobulbaceae bacterium]|nr:rhodanese-like domain-containing protein [Desulfobulbaceae bacterium]
MKRYFYYAGIVPLFILFLLTASCSDSKTDDTATGQSEKTVTSATPQFGRQHVTKPDSPPRSGPIFRSISPREALTMLQQRDDVIFLDVRTPQERAYASIDGSTLVNFWDLVRGKVVLPQGKPILLVCAVGGRSFAVGQIFSKKGYSEVYNLEGGIEQWHKDGLPLVRGNTF